jgi:hypothetical protein
MPARRKTSPTTTKDPSTATIGFEAKLWLAADSRGAAETAEGNRSNNRDATEPSGSRRPTRQGSPKAEHGGANQLYMPYCVGRRLVEMLAPCKGRIYDPACGSGGLFAALGRPCGERFARRKRASAKGIMQLEKFVESHASETLAVAA